MMNVAAKPNFHFLSLLPIAAESPVCSIAIESARILEILFCLNTNKRKSEYYSNRIRRDLSSFKIFSPAESPFPSY